MYPDDKFNRFDAKLDKITDKLSGIDIILERNTNHLAEHMKRSLSNEKAVSELKEKITPTIIQFNIIAKITLLLLSSGFLWKVAQTIIK